MITFWITVAFILGWIDGGKAIKRARESGVINHTEDDSLFSFLIGKQFNE